MPKVGDTFGVWIILAVKPNRQCLCRCRCGLKKDVDAYSLLKGKSSACSSCWQRKLPYDDSKHPRKLRDAAMNAIKRCTEQSHPSYKYYGGRGITVYEPWLKDPLLFVEYLSNLDGCDDLSKWLDRVDNEGNYEPDNLRFVTPKDSHENTRLSHGVDGKWVEVSQ